MGKLQSSNGGGLSITSLLLSYIVLFGAGAYYANNHGWTALEATHLWATKQLYRFPVLHRFAPEGKWQHDNHKFNAVLVSYSPLIMVLEGFLTPAEAAYLKQLGIGKREPSTVRGPNGTRLVTEYRTSTSAVLSRSDPVVRTVMARTAKFQGFVPVEHIETLQMTAYETGQEYKGHYDLVSKNPFKNLTDEDDSDSDSESKSEQEKENDALREAMEKAEQAQIERNKQRQAEEDAKRKEAQENGSDKEGAAGSQNKTSQSMFSSIPENTLNDGTLPIRDRETTIFAMLDVNCEGSCGTQFPLISVDWSNEDARWCELVDCDQEKLTIKAKTGNAVFWRNFDHEGWGDRYTLHAGLPVQKGTKFGLNIWTRSVRFLKPGFDDAWLKRQTAGEAGLVPPPSEKPTDEEIAAGEEKAEVEGDGQQGKDGVPAATKGVKMEDTGAKDGAAAATKKAQKEDNEGGAKAKTPSTPTTSQNMI